MSKIAKDFGIFCNEKIQPKLDFGVHIRTVTECEFAARTTALGSCQVVPENEKIQPKLDFRVHIRTVTECEFAARTTALGSCQVVPENA